MMEETTSTHISIYDEFVSIIGDYEHSQVARKAVEMTRGEGIGVLASFVLGLPGETLQTLRQTLEFAESLKVPYTLNLLTPYVGTEIRERAEEWGIQILSNDWRYYGQGQPLTATPEVGPRHLKGAVNRFRRNLGRYLELLLEREYEGTLNKKGAGELEQYRHRDFLRRLIGEEILERFGSLPGGMGGKGGEELAGAIAPHLGMVDREVQKHLEAHIREGHITLTKGPAGAFRWSWAVS
jgi:hypothetical protein